MVGAQAILRFAQDFDSGLGRPLSASSSVGQIFICFRPRSGLQFSA